MQTDMVLKSYVPILATASQNQVEAREVKRSGAVALHQQHFHCSILSQLQEKRTAQSIIFFKNMSGPQ